MNELVTSDMEFAIQHLDLWTLIELQAYFTYPFVFSNDCLPWYLTSPECRTMERHRHCARGEDFDYPPMDSGGFSPTPHPPPWLGPPPPYEVAIKTTCSSTHLRRAYSDTHLATEPLFGQSREISFEVWYWMMMASHALRTREQIGRRLYSSCYFIIHLKHASVLVPACCLVRFQKFWSRLNIWPKRFGPIIGK